MKTESSSVLHFSESKSEIQSIIGNQKTSINDASSFIQDTNRLLKSVSDDIRPYMNQAVHYYDYVYYTLIGISSFMLVLFMLSILGCLGMFCRRPHPNSKHLCHRGMASTCLTTSISLFFAFTFLFMIVVLVLFFVGTVVRKTACLPFTQLDNNILVKGLTNDFDDLKNFSLQNLLMQVRQSNTCADVTEVNDYLQSQFQFDFSYLTNTTKLMQQIDSQVGALISEQSVSAVNIDTYDILGFYQTSILSTQRVVSALNQTILQHAVQLDAIMQILNETTLNMSGQPIDNTKHILNQYTHLLDNIQMEFNEFAQFQANSKNIVIHIANKLSEFESKFSNETSLIGYIEPIFISATNNVATRYLENALKTVQIPSCKVIANIYDDLSIGFCYEFIDNINGFWLTLWSSLVLNLIGLPFLIVLSKLFTRHYTYEDSILDS
jgi:hypothetical protein